ncbi:putative glutamyl-trna amidotransferase subunit a [Phaeomoniella chlamydospora]|uniref:Putative glutamyl-trna amidotransferase subunit a n=1 Tax=Phaeomoniella chlamydospora TaxID=158046 RepID=A0A0G2ES58_PHACM|nr:putative glutamyl-trna amidotransferase subunit a [Phaeomoniella chlamydospora]
MRSGELTVEDYAKSLLTRIKDRDPVVKAWAYLDPEHVLAAAQELDKIPPQKRGPLHGVAIGVKDMMLTKDLPTQYNSPIYETKKPSGVDAAPVITLRAAGALIFGKTTTTEFAANSEGNHFQNKTSNPHDPNRTPGGSSSGSGAAVGDFQVPIALGTQTGGSTIRPGSFNGIYALKPTWGAISREGLAQYSMTCDTLGLYARSVEDLELLAKVFDLETDDPVSEQPFQIKGAKIGLCKTSVWPKAGPGTIAAWEKAKELLTKHGAEVEDLELPEDFSKIPAWHLNVLAGEGKSSFLGQHRLAPSLLHSHMTNHVLNHNNLSRKLLLESYDNCARLRPIWDSIASSYDIIVTPSVVDEAPLGLDKTGDYSFNPIWTILHVPALNMVGFAGENGLPIGLTLVTGRYRDLHALWVAKGVGEVFEGEGGWKRGNV